jgi:hypothetical protein
MQIEAFIVCIDDVLTYSVAEPDSHQLAVICNEVEATLVEAESKGMKLGMFSSMKSHDVVVACELIFDRNFIKRFDVLISSDKSCMQWLGLPGIETVLTVLGVPVDRAIAVVCNEMDAADAYAAGINYRVFLGDALHKYPAMLHA